MMELLVIIYIVRLSFNTNVLVKVFVRKASKLRPLKLITERPEISVDIVGHSNRVMTT